MSYLGFVKPIFNSYLKRFVKSSPSVLEIGIDTGQSALPLIHNMAVSFDKFRYVGVDIKVNKQFLEQISHMNGVSLLPFDPPSGRDVYIFEENSLAILKKVKDDPEFASAMGKFDLILIDGDHNYDTVVTELVLVQSLCHDSTIIICDDYNSVWAEKDLYYSERQTHAGIDIATPRPPAQAEKKQGVANAVKDFLGSHGSWQGSTFKNLDPVILYRHDVWKNPVYHTNSQWIKDSTFEFAKKRGI